MKAAGVFIFSDGGLDESTVVCSVDPSSGSPVFTDGPFVETKEHLGGFAVVDVPNDAEARYLAGRIAVAVGWPQEVHRFPHPVRSQTDTQSRFESDSTQGRGHRHQRSSHGRGQLPRASSEAVQGAHRPRT